MKILKISSAAILSIAFLFINGCGDRNCSQEFISDNNLVVLTLRGLNNFSTKKDIQKALDECKAFAKKHGENYECQAKETGIAGKEKTIKVSGMKSQCDDAQDKLNKLP